MQLHRLWLRNVDVEETIRLLISERLIRLREAASSDLDSQVTCHSG
jgi:hypothetical protein